MPRIRPYLTSLVSAFVLALPALAGDQAITINGTDGFDPTAVATFVTKFEGELHTLDISIEDSTVELDVTTENPTNGLWQIESTRPDGAMFYLAAASAHQDHSSSFTFKQKTKGGGGGGGGGGNKTYEAISQQIQIFASYPGQPEEEVPRPTSEGDGYYGIILPDNAENPVRIRLVYNREEGYRFSSSTISLEIASGLKIVNRPEGQDNATVLAAELLPGTEVTFDVIHDSENVPVLTQPQPITLILTDQFGAIHEDEVNLIPVEIVPDYNRDGMINDEDRGKATEETPFFFWVNNDDDGNSDPEMQDTPGANVDNNDMEVNTVRDLVDFFPVQLRIQELLKVLPPAEHSYKISHPDGAFHFIEMPDIHPDSQSLGAGSYLRNSAVAEEAVARSISGEMKSTAGEGAELSAGFLAACLDGRGILLFEAVAETQNSFELVVSKKNGGGEVARIRRALPVEIVTNPEAYYWRLNLRPAADGQNVGDAEPPANAKFRDSRKDRWFVFVHGYNVNFDQYRDRNAEIFKRLYQMGNDSKYVAVSWTGDVSQIGGGNAVISPDYWRNVYNAFASSSPLAHKINDLTGSAKAKTVIAAHSLGNMVVSSAICDHGLLAEKYFMMNSAVAKEAYIPSIITTEHNVMSHPDWRTDPVYPDKLWASNWHDLFPKKGDIENGQPRPQDDPRRRLTWQGRFESLKNKTSPWNYYSTGETTAAKNDDGSLPIGVILNGKRAWVAQEMFKGIKLPGLIGGWYKGAWDSHGGWGFNPNLSNPLYPPQFPPVPNPIDEVQLRADPFFDPFTVLKLDNGGANPNPNGTPVTDPTAGAAAHAAEYSVRAWMLAYEIPALSNPTASGPLLPPVGNEYGDSTDMNDDLRDGVWGAWEHGGYLNDMDHVWKLYNDWTTKGNLRK